MVQMLLQRGANINRTERTGATPLYLACESGHFDVTRLLLAGGADADRPNEFGETPLMVASRTGRLDVATLLVVRVGGVRVTRRCGCWVTS